MPNICTFYSWKSQKSNSLLVSHLFARSASTSSFSILYTPTPIAYFSQCTNTIFPAFSTKNLPIWNTESSRNKKIQIYFSSFSRSFSTKNPNLSKEDFTKPKKKNSLDSLRKKIYSELKKDIKLRVQKAINESSRQLLLLPKLRLPESTKLQKQQGLHKDDANLLSGKSLKEIINNLFEIEKDKLQKKIEKEWLEKIKAKKAKKAAKEAENKNIKKLIVPNSPKLLGYNLFLKEYYEKNYPPPVKRKAAKSVTGVIGKEWNSLSEQEKQTYRERAAAIQNKKLLEYKEWWMTVSPKRLTLENKRRKILNLTRESKGQRRTKMLRNPFKRTKSKSKKSFNPYIIFLKSQLEKYPNLTQRQRIKQIAINWNNLPMNKKKQYIKQSQIEAGKHKL
ncbi:hypothetical protein BB560_002083 [Smittium megazygosporum]|uniref:HMG box domain-containing protein n=1 Tax=Smittium megazygosporum TaxID=133381 RepID=A0A2T9ZFT3_9FUNG|nr:hypothetical protein BB560_002083 [Smittium megazygosporum]